MKNNSKKYKVGYKCPPKEYQFKPGQSGNPKGRPKVAKSLVENIENELNELIAIQEQGKIKKITKKQALAKKFVAESLSGKISFAKLIIAILGPKLMQKEISEEEMAIDDLEILKDYIRRKGYEN